MFGEAKFHLEKQLKQCGHHCFPSTTPQCCHCSDLRPHLEGNTYPVYVDGHGWSDTGSRDDGYCPVCNPRNYDSWMTKIEIKLKQKEQQKEELAIILAKQDIALHEDITRIYQDIGDARGKFCYANGDEYEGDFWKGQRHGQGTMLYAQDNSMYTGAWEHNQQHGYGIKDWGDGIRYEGEWKGDKMHGIGKYSMSCGTVIEGRFEYDEFAE